jgi:hypothetical protein
MMSLWASGDDILCIHPGAASLTGVEAVQQGWAYIFAGGPIQIEASLLFQEQDRNMAWHGIEERLVHAEGGRVTTLFTSHIYVLTPSGWRLRLHHASATPSVVSVSGKLH